MPVNEGTLDMPTEEIENMKKTMGDNKAKLA